MRIFICLLADEDTVFSGDYVRVYRREDVDAYLVYSGDYAPSGVLVAGDVCRIEDVFGGINDLCILGLVLATISGFFYDDYDDYPVFRDRYRAYLGTGDYVRPCGEFVLLSEDYTVAYFRMFGDLDCVA